MCGILAGYSHLSIKSYAKALETIDYRGPDATGIKRFALDSGELVLGHRRLAIIDLDSRSNQPFCYQDRYWITYNGEIYNYVELKCELKKMGYHFLTSSDTEVLLAAFDCWGEEMLGRLNGMFSFCIFDSTFKKLFIARDRFGIKPLYYHISSKGIFFASEVKQLLTLGVSNRCINESTFMSLMAFGEFNIDHQTLLKDIHEFHQANYLIINLNENKILRDKLKFKKWYQLNYNLNNSSCSINDYKDILNDAIKIRLRSDVRLGGLLSGGIDSSVIALAMSRQSLKQPLFITATYPESNLDESAYAQQVANKLGVKLIRSFINPKQLIKSLNDITYYYDYPILGRSVIPHYYLYKMVKDSGLKVCLEGQGADESLFGYTSYQYAYMMKLLLSCQLIRFIKEIKSFSTNENVTQKYILKQLIKRLFSQYNNKRVRTRLQENFTVSLRDIKEIGRCERTIDKVIESRFLILKSILHGVDRLSMSSSVEARVPFLDHRIVEAFINAPMDLKVHNGYRKILLRRYLEGYVPDSITYRKDKQGFNAPEIDWIKNELSEYMREYIKKSHIFGLLNTKLILKKYDRFIQGKAEYDRLYWRVFSIMKWCEIFNIK